MAKRKTDPEEKKQKLTSKIMKVLTENIGKAFNYKQVTELIGLKSKKDREAVQDTLFELAASKMVNEGNAGKFSVGSTNSESSHQEGIVDMTRSGAAYIVLDNKKDEDTPDIFVSQNNLHTALHGDRVKVLIYARKRGRQPEGEVVEVIERKRERFVGTVQIVRDIAFLVCDPKQTGGHDIYIPSDALCGATNGQKAVAKITSWPAKAKNPIGEIVEVLGNAGENQTEMHAILAEYDLPYGYPEDVALLAEKIEPGITPSEIAKRVDMRDVVTFTIDPTDAKDYDDALSIRKLQNGHWEVGVHIADVTHYVTPGSPIDDEGYKRATSVYLVDRVVPMLPERLSNFLCSLRQDEEKLTCSVIFEMDDDANIKSSHIARTVIKSNRRFTYDEAQAIIEGGEGDFKEEVLQLDALAKKLRKRRFDEGAISFERVEVRFNIDEKGRPTSVYFKESKDANHLVEEFMLAANRKVAQFIGADELNTTGRKRTPKTFVYRVHDQPNEEKYSKFAQFVSRFGYEANPQKGEEINNAVNRILAQVKGKGEQELVETLAIRTMAKAKYTTHNIGHYGLAFDYYTHFTSPIRRYPDMMVHRLLFSYLDGGRSANGEKYEEMCEHCSDQEIMAAEAERASIKYKQVEFLMDKIGEEFDATISGVTEWGIYAEIIENKCEGMISLRDLTDDSYYFDEDSYCVRGQNTGRKFQLGDPIRIRIAAANLEKKQLDFVPTDMPITDRERQTIRSKENKIARAAEEVKKKKDKPNGMPPKKVLKNIEKKHGKNGKKRH